MTVQERALLKKMLIYRSKHRGCKELDIVLGYFAEQYLETLNIAELEEYADLLNMDDMLLFEALLEQEQKPLLLEANNTPKKIIEVLRKTIKSLPKELQTLQ